MKVIFLNRYFYPDHSATSQMLSDLAFFLAGAGHEVCVVTSCQRYDDAAAGLPARERVDGVEVHRVRTTRFGRDRLVGRAADYATFYLAAGWRLWRIARTGDIVVAETDPPLISVVAWLVARSRGARLVNWVQDVFPEVAEALGVRALSGPQSGFLRWFRNRAFKSAAANVVLGERMAAVVAHAGGQSYRESPMGISSGARARSYNTLCGSELAPTKAQPRSRRKLAGADFMRAVLTRFELGNTLGIGVETQRVEVFAELDCQGQAYVSQTDDGDAWGD